MDDVTLLRIEEALKRDRGQDRWTLYQRVKTRLEPVYSFAAGGFPEGNDHGWSHILRVLERLDELLGDGPLDHLNVHELYLAMLSVLFHDIGVLERRRDHPRRSAQLLALLEDREFGLNEHDRRLIQAAVASHGSQTSIADNCTRLQKEERIGNVIVRPHVVAALVRISDELDEDFRRADELAKFFMGTRLPAASEPFWRFCRRIQGVGIDASSREVVFDVALQREDLSFRVDDGCGGIGFVDWCVNKFAKINHERVECNRYLPDKLELKRILLRLKPPDHQPGWENTIVAFLLDETTADELRERLPRSERTGATCRLVSLSVDADAMEQARPVWGALSEDEAARWHIDAQGTGGRRDVASLQQARWRLEKELVAKGVVVDGSEARFSLALPLSLAAWAGCALRYVRTALVYNYLRRESRHVEIMAPREEVLTSGATADLELFTFREPDPRVDDTSQAVMIFDALGHSTDAQLNRFVIDVLPVGRARRVRLVWLDRSEPFAQEHLLPTLRDLVRSMSRLRAEGVTTFHLGFCTPDVLAFLAGAQLNRFFPIKVYEWDKAEGWYRYVADLPTALERGPRAPSAAEADLQK